MPGNSSKLVEVEEVEVEVACNMLENIPVHSSLDIPEDNRMIFLASLPTNLSDKTIKTIKANCILITYKSNDQSVFVVSSEFFFFL